MTAVYHAQQLPLFPEKQCTKCHQIFPADTIHFGADRYTASGLTSACKDCRKKARKPRKNKGKTITLVCAICAKDFIQKDSYYRRRQKKGQTNFFCSQGCKNTYTKTIPLPDSIGEEYLQGDTLEQIGNRYGVTIVTVRDRLLKAGIPMRLRYAHILEGRNPLTGKKHTEEAKQKCRDAAIRQFSDPKAREEDSQRTIQRMIDGKIKRVSSLEDRVAIELSRRGFVFARQQGIHSKGHRGYIGCVDFMLADGRVIEVNGTFWHTDPRKYPNGPVYASQKYAAEKYNKKVAILAELGVPLIELWEMDLTADFTGTITRALASE